VDEPDPEPLLLELELVEDEEGEAVPGGVSFKTGPGGEGGVGPGLGFGIEIGHELLLRDVFPDSARSFGVAIDSAQLNPQIETKSQPT
jgi:hypothetical protein